MSIKILSEGYYGELCYVYSNDKQRLKALPKKAKKSSFKKLQQAFKEHLKQTRRQS